MNDNGDLTDQIAKLNEELSKAKEDKEFVWGLWRRLQLNSPDLTDAVQMISQREKEKFANDKVKYEAELGSKDSQIKMLQEKLLTHQAATSKKKPANGDTTRQADTKNSNCIDDDNDDEDDEKTTTDFRQQFYDLAKKNTEKSSKISQLHNVIIGYEKERGDLTSRISELQTELVSTREELSTSRTSQLSQRDELMERLKEQDNEKQELEKETEKSTRLAAELDLKNAQICNLKLTLESERFRNKNRLYDEDFDKHKNPSDSFPAKRLPRHHSNAVNARMLSSARSFESSLDSWATHTSKNHLSTPKNSVSKTDDFRHGRIGAVSKTHFRTRSLSSDSNCTLTTVTSMPGAQIDTERSSRITTHRAESPIVDYAYKTDKLQEKVEQLEQILSIDTTGKNCPVQGLGSIRPTTTSGSARQPTKVQIRRPKSVEPSFRGNRSSFEHQNRISELRRKIEFLSAKVGKLQNENEVLQKQNEENDKEMKKLKNKNVRFEASNRKLQQQIQEISEASQLCLTENNINLQELEKSNQNRKSLQKTVLNLQKQLENQITKTHETELRLQSFETKNLSTACDQTNIQVEVDNRMKIRRLQLENRELRYELEQMHDARKGSILSSSASPCSRSKSAEPNMRRRQTEHSMNTSVANKTATFEFQYPDREIYSDDKEKYKSNTWKRSQHGRLRSARCRDWIVRKLTANQKHVRRLKKARNEAQQIKSHLLTQKAQNNDDSTDSNEDINEKNLSSERTDFSKQSQQQIGILSSRVESLQQQLSTCLQERKSARNKLKQSNEKNRQLSTDLSQSKSRVTRLKQAVLRLSADLGAIKENNEFDAADTHRPSTSQQKAEAEKMQRENDIDIFEEQHTRQLNATTSVAAALTMHDQNVSSQLVTIKQLKVENECKANRIIQLEDRLERSERECQSKQRAIRELREKAGQIEQLIQNQSNQRSHETERISQLEDQLRAHRIHQESLKTRLEVVSAERRRFEQESTQLRKDLNQTAEMKRSVAEMKTNWCNNCEMTQKRLEKLEKDRHNAMTNQDEMQQRITEFERTLSGLAKLLGSKLDQIQNTEIHKQLPNSRARSQLSDEEEDDEDLMSIMSDEVSVVSIEEAKEQAALLLNLSTNEIDNILYPRSDAKSRAHAPHWRNHIPTKDTLPCENNKSLRHQRKCAKLMQDLSRTLYQPKFSSKVIRLFRVTLDDILSAIQLN